MSEITVTSQQKLDSLPHDYHGRIYIKFGTPYDRAVVKRKYDSASVVARGNSTVEVRGNSSVETWGNSYVVALGNSAVEAWGNSYVVALSWTADGHLKMCRTMSISTAIPSARSAARPLSSTVAKTM